MGLVPAAATPGVGGGSHHDRLRVSNPAHIHSAQRRAQPHRVRPVHFPPESARKVPCQNSKLGLIDHTDALGTFHTGTTIPEIMGNEVIPNLNVEAQREVAIDEQPTMADARDRLIVDQ